MRSRDVQRVVVLAFLLLGVQALHPTADSVTADVAAAPDVEKSGVEILPPELAEGARLLQREFGLSQADADERMQTQGDRVAFREAVAEEIGSSLGGFRFEPESGVQTVLVTDLDSTEAVVATLAETYQVDIAMELVEYSFAELQEIASEINLASHPIIGPVQRANPDDNTNTVEVFVEPDRIQALQAADLHPAIRLFPEVADDGVDEACTTKAASNCSAG